MSYTIDKSYKARFHGGSRNAGNIKYIVIHYTANTGKSATAKGNAKYFHTTERVVSAHYIVDENDKIYQCVGDLYTAWAVGGDKYPNTKGGSVYGKCTNQNSISIEMVSHSEGEEYYIPDKTISKTIDLTKTLMKKYNVPLSAVVRHYDVTGKPCPATHCISVDGEANWSAFKKKLATDDSTGYKNIGSSTTQRIWHYEFPTLPKRGYFQKGDTGEQVKLLQNLLNWIGSYKLTLDGDLGTKTENVIADFQKDNGLKVDKKFGKDCLAKAKKLV